MSDMPGTATGDAPGTVPQRAIVLGAGTMGRGIAQVLATAGIDVALVDPDPGARDRAIAQVSGALDRRVARGELSASARDDVRARISLAASLEDVDPAPFLVEAVVEVFKRREGIRGLKMTYQAPVLRHFTARFERR